MSHSDVCNAVGHDPACEKCNPTLTPKPMSAEKPLSLDYMSREELRDEVIRLRDRNRKLVEAGRAVSEYIQGSNRSLRAETRVLDILRDAVKENDDGK